VRCDPEQIVITAGTQQAIDIAIRVLLVPGDEVWVEDPGYPLTHAQLLLAKVRPHPIPVDAQGLVVDAGLRKAPRARSVRHTLASISDRRCTVYGATPGAVDLGAAERRAHRRGRLHQ
jgi:aspartate/methionine/tyrosine aminotransferase